MTKKGMRQIHWDNKENRILKKNYLNVTVRDLMELLPNRSYIAIKNRVKILCLKKKDYSKPDKLNLKENDIYLLVGLIEGEGTLSINGKRKNPRISIGNTDFDMIDWLTVKLPIGHIINELNRKSKPFKKFIVSDTRNVLALAKTIQPYLITRRKKKLCSLLMEFCDSRLEKLRKNIHYFSEREDKIIEQMRRLNAR